MIDIQPFETDFDAGHELTATISWATLKNVVLTFRYDTLEEALRAAKQLSQSIDTNGDVDLPTGLVGIRVPDPNRSVIDLLELLLEPYQEADETAAAKEPVYNITVMNSPTQGGFIPGYSGWMPPGGWGR